MANQSKYANSYAVQLINIPEVNSYLYPFNKQFGRVVDYQQSAVTGEWQDLVYIPQLDTSIWVPEFYLQEICSGECANLSLKNDSEKKKLDSEGIVSLFQDIRLAVGKVLLNYDISEDCLTSILSKEEINKLREN